MLSKNIQTLPISKTHISKTPRNTNVSQKFRNPRKKETSTYKAIIVDGLEERQRDWAYTKFELLFDILSNLAFVGIGFAVLVMPAMFVSYNKLFGVRVLTELNLKNRRLVWKFVSTQMLRWQQLKKSTKSQKAHFIR